MKVYEIEGDGDLAWINCSDPEDAGLLDRVTLGLAGIDRSRTIELEVSDWDAPGDWVETDCPRRPAHGTVLLSEQAICFSARCSQTQAIYSTRVRPSRRATSCPFANVKSMHST